MADYSIVWRAKLEAMRQAAATAGLAWLKGQQGAQRLYRSAPS